MKDIGEIVFIVMILNIVITKSRIVREDLRQEIILVLKDILEHFVKLAIFIVKYYIILYYEQTFELSQKIKLSNFIFNLFLK